MSPPRRAPAPAEREFQLVVDGAPVQVRTVGSGDPLLLLNGLGAHLAMWGPLERALRSHFQLIEFDAPGTGRSATPKRPVSVGRLARMATEVLDAFGVGQADVLGYSMGGMVAQQLAGDHPDRVRRVMLVATSPGVGGALGNPKAMLNVVTPLRYMSPRLYNLSIGSMAGGRARRDAEWVARQGTLRLRHRPTMRGYASQMCSLTLWSGLPLLERIGAPVLVVAGDDDPLSPVANGMLLAHLIPSARLLVLRGEGHLMLLDEDSAVLRAAEQFLTADEPDRAESWRLARDIDAEKLGIALAGLGLQLQPWGLIGHLVRRRYLSSDRSGG